MIASEYGFTLEQFGQMTAREVVMCCQEISERKYNDAMFEAKIHGAEVKDDKKAKFTEEQSRLAEKVTSDAFENLKKRREAMNGN